MSKEVFSSAPTLCMNDFSSASPKVIAPKQSSDTLTPDAPSFLYFMISLHLSSLVGLVAFEARGPFRRGSIHAARRAAREGRVRPLPRGAKSGRVCRGGDRRDVGK